MPPCLRQQLQRLFNRPSLLCLLAMVLTSSVCAAQNAYVANSANNTVAVVNTATNLLCTPSTCHSGATYPIPVGHRPTTVLVTPDNKTAYVWNSTDNTVSAINTATDTVVQTLTFSPQIFGMTLSPDGTRVYVAEGNALGSINTATNVVTSFTYSSDGAYGGPSTSFDGTVLFSLIPSGDVTAFLVATTNPSGPSYPGGIDVPSGTYITFALPNGEVWVLSTNAHFYAINPQTPSSNTYSVDIETNPVLSLDGKSVYGANPSNTQVVNISSHASTATIPAPAVGLGLMPTGHTLYAASGATISVINTATNTVTSTISVAGGNLSGVGIQQIIRDKLGKALGPQGCGCGDVSSTGFVSAGEPIDIGSGNMSYQTTDYTTSGQNPLSFTRYYNSLGNAPGISTFANSLGVNWRSTYDRYLAAPSPTQSVFERPGGQQVTFNQVGTTWVPDADVDMTIVVSGSGVYLTDHDDTVELYTPINPAEALLTTITTRNGYTQTMHYNGGGPLSPTGPNQLTSVTDSYGRSLTLTYSGGLLNTVTTPDSTTLTYGYASATGGSQLTSITYPTSPTTSYSYLYANTSLPFALTGIKDDAGNQYATWTYDVFSRALTSQLGSGANLTTLTYGLDNSRTVMNALGVVDTYSYSYFAGLQKTARISRAATSTTAAATEAMTYDTNGYLASRTDWNGNQTTYVNDAHGDPTTINDAVGSAVARTTTIAYDPTWVHLPHTITTPGLTTGFTYDSLGEQLTQVLTDTTTTTIPYSTSGQTRTWTRTWSNGLLASVKSPNNNTTAFGYDSSGALTSVTDALSHITHITAHTGGGLPQTITDPNGVITTKGYDQRQRILSSSVATSAGALATSWGYYNGGDVTTTLPDGSYTFALLDTAHRLTNIADNFNEQKGGQLDALGNFTVYGINDRSGNVAFQRSATFDALGRKLKDTSSTTSASIVQTFDKNGNTLTIADPLSHTTTNVFDALNRLSTSTDANSGIVTVTYDPHNRPLTVKDKNANTTSYVYDGFGDKIQQVSPDSGTTVYHYDGDANLTSKTDGASVVTNWTFDALDRPLTTTYPADTAENVAYTYDQTGHGFGIGRLTSVTDAAGSLSRTYDERGNRLTDKRTVGTTVLTTTYTFDKASRVASLTYPSGATVTYTRDSIGDIIDMPFAATGTDLHNVAVNITHLPWGPMNSWDPENGDRANLTFDKDYRLTNIAYNSYPGTTSFLNWTYGYDNANDVTSITDNLTAANSQTLTYDVLNRLHTAASSGFYGNLSYLYDKNGNVTSTVTGGVTYTDNYTTGTNRLSSITWPSNTQTFGYTGTGNINSINLNGTNSYTVGYNKANRLITATGNGVSLAIMSATYDYAGKRITKGDNGSPAALFTYDLEGNLIEENNGGTITNYIYADGINLGNWAPGEGHLYMIFPDSRGVPLISHDEYGLPNWAAYSTPYGAQTQTVATGTYTGPVTQNLRLPGQYFDHETTFHYNGFRDYMPGVGRYLEADPVGLHGGMNAYAYASGNPLQKIDRHGMESQVLYRVVTLQELKSLQDNDGRFISPSGLPKYFTPTPEAALCYAEISSKNPSPLFNQGPYTLVSTTAPSEVIESDSNVTIEGGIKPVVVQPDNLDQLSPAQIETPETLTSVDSSAWGDVLPALGLLHVILSTANGDSIYSAPNPLMQYVTPPDPKRVY